MTSDKFGHYYWLGFLLMFVVFFGSFLADQLIAGIKTEHWETTGILFLSTAFVICLTIFFRLKNKFKVIDFRDGKIKILEKTSTTEYTWDQVDSLQIVSLTNPPIYILKLSGIKSSVYFVSPFTFLGNYFDNSGLGEFIEKMRTKYDF